GRGDDPAAACGPLGDAPLGFLAKSLQVGRQVRVLRRIGGGRAGWLGEGDGAPPNGYFTHPHRGVGGKKKKREHERILPVRCPRGANRRGRKRRPSPTPLRGRSRRASKRCGEPTAPALRIASLSAQAVWTWPSADRYSTAVATIFPSDSCRTTRVACAPVMMVR